MIPVQSIFFEVSLLEISLNRLCAHIVPKIPIGMLTQNKPLQFTTAKITPDNESPAMFPILKALVLIPIIVPNSFLGEASVIIATLLELNIPAPIPWTTLQEISSAGSGDNEHRKDPIVNTAKPAVYSLTRPKMSDILPKRSTSKVLVTM